MTNIGYQDIVGGSINIYSSNRGLKKWDRINKALKDLKHVGNIKIFLFKKGRIRLLKVKRY